MTVSLIMKEDNYIETTGNNTSRDNEIWNNDNEKHLNNGLINRDNEQTKSDNGSLNIDNG